mmetsp:Transcript_24/g.176  ORF Transcript_24/g.176 Transcript_24/m.176 type:complete len:204 (+) Transcript_24:1309-1920(+)
MKCLHSTRSWGRLVGESVPWTGRRMTLARQILQNSFWSHPAEPRERIRIAGCLMTLQVLSTMASCTMRMLSRATIIPRIWAESRKSQVGNNKLKAVNCLEVQSKVDFLLHLLLERGIWVKHMPFHVLATVLDGLWATVLQNQTVLEKVELTPLVPLLARKHLKGLRQIIPLQRPFLLSSTHHMRSWKKMVSPRSATLSFTSDA